MPAAPPASIALGVTLTRELRLGLITIRAYANHHNARHSARHSRHSRQATRTLLRRGGRITRKITRDCDPTYTTGKADEDETRSRNPKRRPARENSKIARPTSRRRPPRRRYTCCTSCTFVHFSRFKRQTVRIRVPSLSRLKEIITRDENMRYSKIGSPNADLIPRRMSVE